MNLIALIPARAGSKRIPGKNTKLLGGNPLIQWTIEAARASKVFSRIAVCSDDTSLVDLAYEHLAGYIKRAPSSDDEPDIDWVRHALAVDSAINLSHHHADAFAILRPTSPFRAAETIRRAWATFQANQPADSLRAIQAVREHPGKQWTWEGDDRLMKPYIVGNHPDGTPWHSSPTQTLQKIYVQNASLEISWTTNIVDHGTISGRNIIPFFTEGFEGYDVNTEADWRYAEYLVETGQVLGQNRPVAG